MNGLVLAIAGAIIGVAGFFFFQNASETIAQGDFFFGLGWAFSDMSKETAVLYKYGGIAGMAVGGVMILAGLIQIFRNK